MGACRTIERLGPPFLFVSRSYGRGSSHDGTTCRDRRDDSGGRNRARVSIWPRRPRRSSRCSASTRWEIDLADACISPHVRELNARLPCGDSQSRRFLAVSPQRPRSHSHNCAAPASPLICPTEGCALDSRNQSSLAPAGTTTGAPPSGRQCRAESGLVGTLPRTDGFFHVRFAALLRRACPARRRYCSPRTSSSTARS